MVRIQRYLVDCGLGSRRQCDEYVTRRRVEVNGVIAGPGLAIDPERDRVSLDGERIRPLAKRHCLAMNKPRGTICTASDPKGRPTVYSLLPRGTPANVHSVGRLDFQSEGLLLFTDDGGLAAGLMRPGSAIERVYHVKMQGRLPPWAAERLTRGVRLSDGPARAIECEIVEQTASNTWLRVTLAEGRYREVRRMFESIGLNVLKLKRVRFGPIPLGRLKIGEVRELSRTEVEALRKAGSGEGTT